MLARISKAWKVTASDPKRVLTTGSFRVLKFNPSQKPLVAFGIVPIADSHDLEDRSLVAVVRNAKAVTKITVSLSLTWLALEQRKETITTGGFLERHLLDS
jgi:hypothetical protein